MVYSSGQPYWWSIAGRFLRAVTFFRDTLAQNEIGI